MKLEICRTFSPYRYQCSTTYSSRMYARHVVRTDTSLIEIGKTFADVMKFQGDIWMRSRSRSLKWARVEEWLLHKNLFTCLSGFIEENCSCTAPRACNFCVSKPAILLSSTWSAGFFAHSGIHSQKGAGCHQWLWSQITAPSVGRVYLFSPVLRFIYLSVFISLCLPVHQ